MYEFHDRHGTKTPYRSGRSKTSKVKNPQAPAATRVIDCKSLYGRAISPSSAQKISPGEHR